VFEDEFGLSFSEPVGSTWAPQGQTPYLKRVGKYRRELSTLAGLTITGKVFKKYFKGSINSEKVIEGLEHIRCHLHRPFILIWDHSRAQLSRLVQQYLAQHPEIHTEFLPVYAPELNPEEFCHGNVKHHLTNAVFLSTTDIRQKLDRGFARLRRRPDLLLACFHHAGLSLNQLW
jgi:transposase